MTVTGRDMATTSHASKIMKNLITIRNPIIKQALHYYHNIVETYFISVTYTFPTKNNPPQYRLKGLVS